MTAPSTPAPGVRVRALVLALLVVVFWGLSFVATRYAVGEIAPLTLAFLRFAVALAVLWPWVRRSVARTPLDRRDRIDLFLLGFLGVTVVFVLENVGLQYTTASHGAVLVSVAPLATVLTEAALSRRWPRRRVVIGLLVSMAGILLLVAGDTSQAAAQDATVLGDLLLLSTVAIWVVYGFLLRRLATRHPVGSVTNASILWGVLTLAPLAAVETWHVGLPSASPTAWLAVLGLGVLCSALAYLWWNQALHVLGIATTNSLIYGIPLVAVLGGIVFLGEPLSLEVVLGSALVIGGLVLANLRRPSTRRLEG